MSNKTKTATVWMLANRNGEALARGNPSAGCKDSRGVPCPPFRLVSFVDEPDFFMQDIVWARRKWELEETGVQREWNEWCGNLTSHRVRPVKVRMVLEFGTKEKGTEE